MSKFIEDSDMKIVGSKKLTKEDGFDVGSHALRHG